MKYFTLFLFSLSFLATTALLSPAKADTPTPLAPGWGTDIHIEMRDKLTTKRSEQGEHFEAELASDLYHRDDLIARKGTPIRGRVTHLQEGQQRPQEIRAEMELLLTEIEIDGKWIPLETKPLSFQTERNFSGLKVGGATAVGAGLFGLKGAAAGSLVGLGWAVITKDRQIRIKRRAELMFRLRRPGKLKRAARRACDC